MVRDGFETIPLALQLLGDYVAHVHIGAHEPMRGELDENGRVSRTQHLLRSPLHLQNLLPNVRFTGVLVQCRATVGLAADTDG